MTHWVMRQNDANIELMSETLKISPITACVLANRNIRTKNSAIKFLNPLPSYMHEPSLLKDIDKAIAIIKESIGLQEKIVIYGDYDVDGILSTVILYKALKNAGADVMYYIPHREEEGYGLSFDTVDKLNALGVKLVVTCDNGISSRGEVDYLKELGIKVIIIDHHEPCFAEDGADIIPNADAVINPKQKDCPYPFKPLCAAGICFKFTEYFYQNNNYQFDKTALAFAAIATVCDVVDLTDENRVLVKAGLDVINNYQFDNIGLSSLIRLRQLENKKIDTFEVGFILGPCINASGRLERASIAVELFLAETREQADALAQKLIDLNNERKTLTGKAVESAMASISQNDKVLVMYNPAIHESIAGIVAGRVKDAINHPVIMLSKSGSLLKGSARSVEGYNMFEALYACRDLFERFGGHPMAAGLTMKEENLPLLKARLNDGCKLTEFAKYIYIDKEIPLDDITYELAGQLQMLSPFGKENKEPLFVTRQALAHSVELIGEAKTTLRFTFDGGRKIKGICFGKVEQLREMLRDKGAAFVCGMSLCLDIAYCIEINEYNNNRYVQLKITDFIL